MTHANAFPAPPIDLPPSMRVILGVLWEAAAMTLAKCLVWFGAPETARLMPWLRDHPPLRHMLMLRRGQKILRCVMFIYARYFGVGAIFAPTRNTTTRNNARRAHDDDDASTWSVAFLMPPRLRPLVCATNALQPQNFSAENRNPMRVIARRMEGLRRVLSKPMPHIRRIARALTRERFIADAVPEKRRKPPADRRELWDELQDARHRLWWAFSPDNPRFDSS